jgi:hypothetical protein
LLLFEGRAPITSGACASINYRTMCKGELVMTSSRILAVALIAASAPLLAGSASAAPMVGSAALKNAAAAPVETVQFRRGVARHGAWRGGGWRGGTAWHGGGWRGGRWIGPAAGLAAGAIIGGAIASSPYNYGYYGGNYAFDPGYTYSPGYYGYSEPYASEPYVAVTPGASAGSDDAYCSQRYRSYDPASGTFLGYDGNRHPCP